MSDNKYLDLVTSEYQGQPDFEAVIRLITSVLLQMQLVYGEMITKFDLDVATGNQLDIIGQWVGITRNVAIPITDVYFSWDADFSLGWEFGVWQPALAPTSITVLPDAQYRTLIKAKIAANRWDGTTDGAYAIWDQLFTDTTILIVDHQDMTYDLGVIGGIIDSLTLALITGGYIPLKPEGVRVSQYFVSVDTGPVFAWDLESELLQGWEEGSWVRELSPT